MIEVDRIVTILKPTAVFLQWLQQLPDANPEMTLEELRSDCTALLVPAFDSPEEADEYIQEIYEGVFLNELENWCEDNAYWPRNLSYEFFLECFELEHNSMVYDVTDEAEWEEEDDDGEEDLDESEEEFTEEEDEEE